MSFLLAVLGALLVLEGIPYFAFPAKVKQWAALMQEVPERSLRVMGIVTMAVGMLILYVIRFF